MLYDRCRPPVQLKHRFERMSHERPAARRVQMSPVRVRITAAVPQRCLLPVAGSVLHVVACCTSLHGHTIYGCAKLQRALLHRCCSNCLLHVARRPSSTACVVVCCMPSALHVIRSTLHATRRRLRVVSESPACCACCVAWHGMACLVRWRESAAGAGVSTCSSRSWPSRSKTR